MFRIRTRLDHLGAVTGMIGTGEFLIRLEIWQDGRLWRVERLPANDWGIRRVDDAVIAAEAMNAAEKEMGL